MPLKQLLAIGPRDRHNARNQQGWGRVSVQDSCQNIWRGVMHITSEDAVVMYARACRAWYGPRAPRVVADKIEELRRAGDHSGIMAWSKVAEKLSQPIDSLINQYISM
jgi:predicted NBD/HSP70 family sugar kinase